MRCALLRLLVLGAGLFLQAGAEAEPLSTAAKGLLSDVDRIVSAEAAFGWFVDDDAQRAIRPAVLESVCRAPLEARKDALATLEARHKRWGDPRMLYEARGRKLTDDVEDAIDAKRKLAALRAAIDSAERDCPFWVTPESDFSGRQSDRERLTLSLESGGNAQVRHTEEAWTLGGGALLRVLGGYGFDERFSLVAGVEFGGSAMIKPGVEPTELVINYFPAIPIVARFHDVLWHYDVETAPVALFQADNGNLSFGFRTGFGLGVSALRTRGFLPWGGAVVAYEYYFATGGRAPQHFVRGGLRVGFVWDP